MILKDVRDNKIQSYFIVGIFLAVITLVIYFICTLFNFGEYAAIIALIFSVTSSLITYYNCDKIVLSLNNARPANSKQDRLLSTILDNLCIASGLPKPKLYVIESKALNAFATGRNPNNAVICFTTGIIDKLNKYELEGVMAHELSHIKNYDILLSTVISVFVGFVVLITDIIFRSRVRISSSNDNNKNANGIIQILGLIFLILSPIFTKLIQLAISRKREYLADASAVEITRNPSGLISALKKLSDDDQTLKNASNATAHMYIVNPLKDGKENIQNLFSTHPPIEDRISRLEKIN